MYRRHFPPFRDLHLYTFVQVLQIVRAAQSRYTMTERMRRRERVDNQAVQEPIYRRVAACGANGGR